MDPVSVDRLTKRYGRNGPLAIDSLSFSIGPGEVFGLLGPNGAGKTTTVSVLTTRAVPTSGKAFVGGIDVLADPVSAKQVFAVVPQRNNLDRGLTARQNLLFHAAYHRMPKAERKRRADQFISWLGLEDHADGIVDELSGGLAQRVMIGRALMHRPKVMFLDEPTTGLDPQSRLFVHDRIVDLREQGVTVVVTTHDMEEAAKVCDQVGIIDHGKLLALDTPEALTKSLPGRWLTVTVESALTPTDDIPARLGRIDSVTRVEAPPSRSRTGSDGAAVTEFRLYCDQDPATLLPSVLAALRELHCEILDLSFGKSSLEDVFIDLTGEGLR